MKRLRMDIVKQEIEDPEEKIALTRVKTEEIKCELCETICCSISELQSHTISEHIPSRKTSSPKVCCQQCDASFESFAHFASHMKNHLSGGSSSSNSDSSNTTNTSSSSSSSSTNSLYCPMCPLMTFRDETSRLEHLTIQHLQMLVPQHICTECEASFINSTILANHFSQTHLRIKFECVACNFVADSEKLFKEHSKTHSRQTNVFGCSACGCTFHNQTLLLTHVQLCHHQETTFYSRPSLVATTKSASSPKGANKNRTLQCSVCDESVVGEDGLDEHRLLRHCKIRYSDKCADCHENIKTDDEFVKHCVRHTKDLTIHCPICRQTLRSEVQVHAHKHYHMTRPTGDETGTEENGDTTKKVNETTAENNNEYEQQTFEFVCPICGEKFTDGMRLIEHGRQHSNGNTSKSSKRQKK